MTQDNIPEYLYHYTSVENLALILRNRTIRLNSIRKMDDLQEAKTSDIQNVGQYVFISSWTDDSTESIPMWKIYTPMNSGVRIKLPANPFKRMGTTAEPVQKHANVQVEDSTHGGRLDTFLDIGELLAKNIFSPQAWLGDILEQVEYTADKALLEPTIFKQDETGLSVEFGALGKHKNVHWEFQHEWRYIMRFLPMQYDPTHQEEYLGKLVADIVNGCETMPFDFYDLEIAAPAFSEMEIVASPQMTAGNKVLLNALVEKYNPTAKICDSELLGLL